MDKIRDLIDRLPLFREFTDDERDHLAQQEHTFIRFEPNEFIIREGAREKSFYILIKGAVRVTRNDMPDQPLAVLKSGAIFGEISFLTRAARTTNVIAHEEASVVMRLDSDILQAMSPIVREKIKDHLIHLLAARINKMNDSLLQLSRR
ncbi:MAG: cyclic nucleotide-binding domain-containing protein [Magnetococcales bacterium]|nr:cyclic nucleotide-binding domain-containing protein [Magnetococcales bacterium]